MLELYQTLIYLIRIQAQMLKADDQIRQIIRYYKQNMRNFFHLSLEKLQFHLKSQQNMELIVLSSWRFEILNKCNKKSKKSKDLIY